MKTRAFGLLVFSTFGLALGGCLDEPTCPYGEVLVQDGNYRGGGVCVRRAHGSTPAGTATPPPASTGATLPPVSAPDPAPSSPPPVTSPAPVGTCGGFVAQGDSVRVVDKGDLAPTFGDATPNLSDGSYALVQATFFRASQSASPVRSLKAALGVRGPTLTVNAQDTSVPNLPAESLTFLLGAGSGVTKTCDSTHGSISAWFFPFTVGASTQAQMHYDGASGFVRVVVNRSDGATELVFAH